MNPYKVNGTDWILASFMAKEELESGARKIVKTIAVSAVTILIIAFLLLSYVAGNITKPILAVTKKVQDYADLNFSTDSKSKVEKFMSGKDEIGNMVRALKIMRDNVADFIFTTSEAASGSCFS